LRGGCRLPFVPAAQGVQVAGAAGRGAGQYPPRQPLSGDRLGARRAGMGRQTAGIPAFARRRRTDSGDHRALRAPQAADCRIRRGLRRGQTVAEREFPRSRRPLGRIGGDCGHTRLGLRTRHRR